SIGTAVLSTPLAPGDSVVLAPPSFVAAGVGDHELQVTIRSVTPAETDVADNTLAIDMTVGAVVKPPPNGGGFSLHAAIFASALEATRFLLQHPRQPVHFRNLQGREAVGNLWSTRERVAAALRVSIADLLPKLMDAQTHPADARVVTRAEFLRHETLDVDLRELPVPKLFPKDAGRYVTAGVWVAEWQGVRNLSFHRILLLGKDRG